MQQQTKSPLPEGIPHPCTLECPAHINVPNYLRMIAAGEYDKAVGVIREKVPFPHALGYVCTHYCEKGCKRKGLNEAISIRDLKRFAVEHDTKESWKEKAYHLPATGKKVAVIGGGHGLSNMLRGLKQYTENISAIVTVADDGGGSGMLRQDLGMPPPGDIRSCMEALANTEPVMRELLHYRFTEGSLAGQSFGNLFLAALNGISGSFDEAVSRMSEVLAITGRVLPVTTRTYSWSGV